MIQTISHRPSYRSPVGARLLFRDLVRHHNLPSLRDASPNPDDNTASHLGDGSGLPTHNSPSGERAARSQLLFMLNHLPPAGLARTSVSSWISQSPRLDQAGQPGRAAGPAIVHVSADLAGWFGCCITSHWPAGSGLKFGSRFAPAHAVLDPQRQPDSTVLGDGDGAGVEDAEARSEDRSTRRTYRAQTDEDSPHRTARSGAVVDGRDGGDRAYGAPRPPGRASTPP